MSFLENLPAFDHLVSVVIPVKNAGSEFRLLLEKLKTQKGVKTPEIVIVDSGSDDGTPDTARRYGCKVIEIPPQSFTHSYARNLGAEAAGGEFLLLMVQDALPAGEDWLYRLLKFLLDNADKKVVAVSCMEFPRSDSDLIYNYQTRRHYKFLECREQDKIMEWRGEDYLSLRKNGQLSNAACLIKRDVFDKYKFEGAYAEDLTLGIKLISEGYRMGLLSSVKVIHSHNRHPYYYLKRGFVETVYLADKFNDFNRQRINEPGFLFAQLEVLFGITENISQNLQAIQQEIKVSELFDLLFALIKTKEEFVMGEEIRYPELLFFRKDMERHQSGFSPDGREQIIDAFEAYLSNVELYLEEIYPSLDPYLLRELEDLIWKAAALIAGIYWAYFFLYCRTQKVHETLCSYLEAKLKAEV